MEDKSKIANLRVANRMFAKYLEEKKLIIPTDSLIETTNSIADSASIFMTEKYPMSIVLCNVSPESCGITFENPESGVNNYICNGAFACTGICARKMLDKGAFNIGICTKDDKEYKKAKTFYQKFGRGMLAIGVPVSIYEEELKDKELGESKLYLLSYRAK